MTPSSKFPSFAPILFILWGIYAVLTFLAPIDPASLERFHISTLDVQLVRVSFQIPILILWGAVFYGAFRFARYTKSIEGAPEEPGLRALSAGLFVFLAGLIVPSFLNVWSSYYPGNADIEKFTSLTNQYVSIGSSLIAFLFLAVGSVRLANLSGRPFSLKRALLLSVGAVAILGGLYLDAVFKNPDRLIPTSPGVTNPTYYLPSDAWIVGSVILPYLIVWCVGFFAALALWHFTKYVDGVIYQKAFRAVARGIVWLVCTSIGLQLLGQFGAYFVETGFSMLLLIIYILLAIIAAGYLFIAYGARELARLESA